MAWTGNIINRISEERMFCDEIKVGTGMTEYSYSDRDAYEVVAVKDQKHITVREYDHRLKDGAPPYSNDWELISDPSKPECDMVKRGKYWYWVSTVTLEDLSRIKDQRDLLSLCVAGFDPDLIRKNGKQTRYRRAKVSFGVADYYYDYSF